MSVAAQHVATPNPVILVLEDEPLIALDLQFAFEDRGATVHLAASCEDAHVLLTQHAIDAAVLDVNLGRGSTCEKVAATLRERGVPFILHTGDLDRQGEAMRKLDAVVVPKPTPADLVVAALYGQLDAHA